MIRFRNVHFSYRQSEPILKGVDLDIPAGLTLVLGPNGSGKSTLLKLAAGIERPDQGTAEIEGYNLWRDEVAARSRLAYISEQPDLTPYATIRDVIYLVCRLRSETLEKGHDALRRAGLWNIAHRSIRELSSGQRRRAVLAAAWVGSPRIVLLDEPLESLDRAIRGEILAWIDRLLSCGAAVVIATHEIEAFLKQAARALVIAGGACRQFETLPAETTEKLAFLEALSRGI
jgi:ABC-2 type transport system ATP-binding protein